MGASGISRRHSARFGALAASALAGVALVCSGSQAGAAARPTVASVQRKLAKLTSLEDQAVQAYDQSAQDLSAAQRQLTAVNREVSVDHAQLLRMRVMIAQIAASAYENTDQTSFGALLTDPSPQLALSQAAILQHLSSVQDAELGQALAAGRAYAAAQATARRIAAAVRALERQRLARRDTIAAAVRRQKALLAQLTAQQRASLAGAGGATTASAYTGPTGTQADAAVAFAYAQLGKPYVWGATGPSSYDCSGLVQAAWAHAGVAIPRTTNEQWVALPHVAMSDIQPGDLVFFDSIAHVAIYVGGNMIIDAPQPGEYVEKVSLSSSWYAANLDGAARP